MRKAEETMRERIIRWIHQEAVLAAACVLAAGSAVLVPPDRGYLDYIDFRTLILLFCLMTVMAGFQKLGVFRLAGRRLLGQVTSDRGLTAVLGLLCFFFSMAVTNDVALLTFVPFGIAVLRMAGMEREAPRTVILQTIAANLGSMLTPVGNPQNLYLYARSGRSALEFAGLMLPFWAASFALLLAAVRLSGSGGRGRLLAAVPEKEEAGGRGLLFGTLFYLILFGLCLLAVARMIPAGILLVAVAAAVGVRDRGLFGRVDYSLLGTFAAFFVFIGNMGRIPAFQAGLERVLRGHETVTAIAASQVISNVPAALLLSGFTENWDALIIGTNLGGLGTLIASMASLISYKQIAREYPKQKGRYLREFTLWNAGFLLILCGVWAALG